MQKEYKEHPSYALMGFSRSYRSGATPLFGSSVKHRDTITMVLKHAEVCRDLKQDWYHGRGRIVEVEMSYTQFAEMITSLNMGDGVPCTLRWLDGEYIEPCPYENKNDLHLSEFKKDTRETYEDTQNLIKRVSELFSSKKSFNKKEQEEILSTLHSISMNIGVNQDFAVSQFQRQMEQTISEGKGEIENFFQNKLNSIAQNELVRNGDRLIEEMKARPPIEYGGSNE